MSEPNNYYANVLLPLPLEKNYTYKIPAGKIELLSEGSRVVVQFGKKRYVTAIITSIHQQKPNFSTIKEITEILDSEPVITKPQLALIDWVAKYYMCTTGEVLAAALPSALKLSSETHICLHEDPLIPTGIELTKKEQEVMDYLKESTSATMEDISELLDQKAIQKIIQSLLEKKMIYTFEELEDKYKPRKAIKLKLLEKYNFPNGFKQLFELLSKHPKQVDILMKYIDLTQRTKEIQNKSGVLKRKLIEAGCSVSTLNTLIKKGIFESFEIIVSRFEVDCMDEVQIHKKSELSDIQVKARDEILKLFETKNVVLIHGVTGSGKTEIYVDLISQVINKGKQVLYILPEIALTHQIITRLKSIFGQNIRVYHSKCNDMERAEIWNDLLHHKFQIIVGARSAVFLPFSNLGLIIVDEEHENTFKQHEPAPRYHARETATMLGQFHSSKVLFGTATPSLESYHNAESGKWGLVELTQRYTNTPLPILELADIKQQTKWKKMKGLFSEPLINAMTECLNKKEQMIIFQNRKGFAPYMSCGVCGWVQKCENCAVSLTYYKFIHQCKCNYCGYTITPPSNCPNCESSAVIMKSFGTEKIEDEIKVLFPSAKVQRMDMDTTRGKNNYKNIIDDFDSGKVDILVGTQMVSKGLDFHNVSLVGIIDADQLLNFPDFRAHERAFQLMEQVSGRAGRREKIGKVIIQTRNVDHPVINYLYYHDYKRLYKNEIQTREENHYPPFIRMIKLIVKHKNKDKVEKIARIIANNLLIYLGKERILGPEYPLISKIKNHHLMSIFIKLEKKGINLEKTKELIKEILHNPGLWNEIKESRITVDVDPV